MRGRLLHETIAVERDCCPSFGFDYQPAERRLSITVARPDQAPALDALHYALTGTDAPIAAKPLSPPATRAPDRG